MHCKHKVCLKAVIVFERNQRCRKRKKKGRKYEVMNYVHGPSDFYLLTFIIFGIIFFGCLYRDDVTRLNKVQVKKTFSHIKPV